MYTLYWECLLQRVAVRRHAVGRIIFQFLALWQPEQFVISLWVMLLSWISCCFVASLSLFSVLRNSATQALLASIWRIFNSIRTARRELKPMRASFLRRIGIFTFFNRPFARMILHSFELEFSWSYTEALFLIIEMLHVQRLGISGS